MKTSKRYQVKAEKIHSLEDLRIEKLRLRLEILKAEESIHAGYRDILNALSFKNIANNVISDVTSSSTILTKALSFGTSFLAKRRKKRQNKAADNSAQHGS
jgi:hypothetical protein